MAPSQGRSGARLDYVKTAAARGRCRSWQMTFFDTAGSRMPSGAGSALIDCHARQLATGKTLRDQEAPGSIALLHTCAARDDTSVPTVSARAPPAG
jgi:type IV pilus biogenesis protein CpaD/CtpE